MKPTKAARSQCLNRVQLASFWGDQQWRLYAGQSARPWNCPDRRLNDRVLLMTEIESPPKTVGYSIKYKGSYILRQTVPSEFPSCRSNQGSVSSHFKGAHDQQTVLCYSQFLLPHLPLAFIQFSWTYSLIRVRQPDIVIDFCFGLWWCLCLLDSIYLCVFETNFIHLPSFSLACALP